MNLVELAKAGDVTGVLRELAALTPEQRAAHAPDVEALFAAEDWDDWRKHSKEQRVAMYTAQLGCWITPEAAAAGLRKPTFKIRHDALVPMADVLNLYPATWQAELVARISEQNATAWHDHALFVLADHIIQTTGCPAPTCDTYINAWLADRHNHSGRDQPWRPLNAVRGADFLELLRNDPCTLTLLPLVVARPGVPLRGVWALSQLAADGVIDRAALVHRVFAEVAKAHPAYASTLLEELALTPAEQSQKAAERNALAEPALAQLLQNGSQKQTAPHLALLRALGLTPAEKVPFLRDHVAMLDLSSPVAGYGQEVLIELDTAGLLEDDVRTEASERVLLRPEKKLVRAQLTWLDRVARRDPTRTGQILLEVAIAFQHADLALQEQALKIVARHLPTVKRAADGSVPPELRKAAESLSPGLAARAAELFGPPQDSAVNQVAEVEPYVEVLPAVPEPRPIPGPIQAAAEVAQELAVVLANRDDVVAFERALDGLVRHSHLDRAALATALTPVMRKAPEPVFHIEQTLFSAQTDLYDVAAALRGDEPRPWHMSKRKGSGSPGELLKARLNEAIELIESGTQPFLLALPTHSTGALDAHVLVERIAELERLGVTPAPIDLAQALLRVTPTTDEHVHRAAGELRSDAGQQLAQWLRDGGLPHQDSTPQGWPVSDPTSAEPKWWPLAVPGLDHEPPLPPVAAALITGTHERASYPAPFCAAQLPHHRDVVAARVSGGGDVLRRLAESGGAAGFAMHRKILAHLDTERDTAVDALLILAAQGQLDSALIAGQLQVRLRRQSRGAKRIADGLRAAAETGAYATIWSILQAALPALLRDEPIREAGAFLAVAVECASRCGAKGHIPEVDAVAARTGSTQTVKNARLLRDVLR
ncbi:DUF6493 family protein [Micromonospora avicenniae]|uniref:DUF7824 domain-containing protein n=1 Tax=Micromonospora avicenniae TaxID=1198245 RepID=A0A1N7FU61_9ACTN|nr:DUF6493 family protein [Micromonospora avicenniae]SIS03870.1 hypothetical protein SAMN05444858_1495 [Micromonospora avicenniae]